VRIHHLAFRTDDVRRLASFYRALFDFPVLRDDRSVWLDAGGTILMLEPRETNEPTVDSGTRELTCFAIAAEDAPTVLARLDASGITVEDRTGFTFYVRDPDGRRIGLSSHPTPLSRF
jgi:glyoxylase I family protein